MVIIGLFPYLNKVIPSNSLNKYKVIFNVRYIASSKYHKKVLLTSKYELAIQQHFSKDKHL